MNHSGVQKKMVENSKRTTSPPMLIMDSCSAMNHSDFHASEFLRMRFLIHRTGNFFQY